jgi:hypothetical protein
MVALLLFLSFPENTCSTSWRLRGGGHSKRLQGRVAFPGPGLRFFVPFLSFTELESGGVNTGRFAALPI